jgi:sorting nexin-29
MVLMLRMDGWAETQGLRATCQAGFRTGRSTTDNVFLLQHAIETSRGDRKPLYAAFIDFRKAYDTINRQLLWRVLHGMGVYGRILTVLQNLYTGVSLRVRVAGEVGESFGASVGVRQGDPLSPLLFGIFIDRFEKYLAHHCTQCGVSALQAGGFLRALLYADDLTLLAQSKADLQQMLDCLQKFADMNLMTVNLKKSKLMAFGAVGRCKIGSGEIRYGGEPLGVVQEFVFLGVTFHASQSHVSKHVKDNSGYNLSKAKLALLALSRRTKELGIHNVKVLCNLFNTLVLSVLNYCCPVWSVYHLQDLKHGSIQWGKKANSAEDLQRSFLRRICGAPDSVTVGVLMCELHRSPVLHSWCKQCIQWYNTVVKRPQGDLVRMALVHSLSVAGNSWGQAFHNMVRCVDEVSSDLVRNVVPINAAAWAQSLHDKWQKEVWGAWADPGHQAPPVRDTPQDQSRGFKNTVYCLWVNDLSSKKGQQWVYHLNRQQQVLALAAFRMSYHKLNIEVQRRSQVARHDRLCTCCQMGMIEDEYHMMHECPAYATIRSRFTDVIPARLPFEGIDAHMMRTMNPTAFDESEIPQAWKRLADFIINAMAARVTALEH